MSQLVGSLNWIGIPPQFAIACAGRHASGGGSSATSEFIDSRLSAFAELCIDLTFEDV
jgi:hypothetical protein